MARVDDLELVVRLAALTEDRAPEEQRALLAVAAKVEAERNATTTRNLRDRWGEPASILVSLVEATYDPNEGRPVRLGKAEREKLERRRVRWNEAYLEGRRPL